MKIYLAGNGAIPKNHLDSMYKVFKHRLFTYFEIGGGGFSYAQWIWLMNKLKK